MPYHTPELVTEISRTAQELRIEVLQMVFRAQSGHIGGSYSAAEILSSLYFHHLHLDPARPDWPERDRMLVSKGHCSALLYAALAFRGYFPREELRTFRQLDSRLQGHPDRLKLPGVEISAGPLGHGIAVGTGMALALRMASAEPSSHSSHPPEASAGRVYVLLGDGEINAGIVWEGALAAAKYRLGNLTAILDCNGVQQTGPTAKVLPTEPVLDKWKAFGWSVQEIHGHEVGEVLGALDRADEVHDQPSMIVARTIKGKGVSFMENDHRWHGMPPNQEQFEAALAELQGGLARWQA